MRLLLFTVALIATATLVAGINPNTQISQVVSGDKSTVSVFPDNKPDGRPPFPVKPLESGDHIIFGSFILRKICDTPLVNSTEASDANGPAGVFCNISIFHPPPHGPPHGNGPQPCEGAPKKRSLMNWFFFSSNRDSSLLNNEDPRKGGDVSKSRADLRTGDDTPYTPHGRQGHHGFPCAEGDVTCPPHPPFPHPSPFEVIKMNTTESVVHHGDGVYLKNVHLDKFCRVSGADALSVVCDAATTQDATVFDIEILPPPPRPPFDNDSDNDADDDNDSSEKDGNDADDKDAADKKALVAGLPDLFEMVPMMRAWERKRGEGIHHHFRLFHHRRHSSRRLRNRKGRFAEDDDEEGGDSDNENDDDDGPNHSRPDHRDAHRPHPHPDHGDGPDHRRPPHPHPPFPRPLPFLLRVKTDANASLAGSFCAPTLPPPPPFGPNNGATAAAGGASERPPRPFPPPPPAPLTCGVAKPQDFLDFGKLVLGFVILPPKPTPSPSPSPAQA